VTDALAVLEAVAGLDLDDTQADAVGLLALVAGQDVEPGNEEGTWRIIPRTKPERIVSTIDPESRHIHKSVSSYRDGYKAHFAIEPLPRHRPQPHLARPPSRRRQPPTTRQPRTHQRRRLATRSDLATRRPLTRPPTRWRPQAQLAGETGGPQSHRTRIAQSPTCT